MQLYPEQKPNTAPSCHLLLHLCLYLSLPKTKVFPLSANKICSAQRGIEQNNRADTAARVLCYGRILRIKSRLELFLGVATH